MTFSPKALQYYRKRLTLSQQELADKSKVSKRAIARLETGQTVSPNANTCKKLARALQVAPEKLSKEPSGNADEERITPFHTQIKMQVLSETTLYLNLIEERYGIPVNAQIEMAPLFTAILAEGSLLWRREKLAEFDKAVDKLHEQATGSLALADATGLIDERLGNEEESIKQRDLFGRHVGEGIFSLGFDPENHNPFADYLRELASKFDADILQIDQEGDLDINDMPCYEIERKKIEKITGGNSLAERALTFRHARLSDIPEHLRGDDAKDERINWLISKIPPKEKDRMRLDDLAEVPLDDVPKEPSTSSGDSNHEK